jgi:hypothetical protein
MKTILMLLSLACSLSIAQEQWDTKISPNMPSLEKAYEGRVEITRDAPTPQGVVCYYVKIYDPEVISVGRSLNLCQIILAVSNAEGKELASVPIEISGMLSGRPSKDNFCSFQFFIHESCEKYSVVNLGSNNGMRNEYSGYKLPAKSISRKQEAEPAGADQPATKPADKPAVKDQPSTPTPTIVPR